MRTEARRAKLAKALRAKGIAHERVLEAIASVPRHEFIPDASLHRRAYEDTALPIPDGQTISQPYTVAYMTALLDPQPGEKILEIGTGSGYQAAVLASLGAKVYSVERHRGLFQNTRALLKRLGYRVQTRHGDGTHGWSAASPFDGILVTAAGRDIPPALVDQLRSPSEGREGGRLVMPVGERNQRIVRVRRTEGGTERETLAAVQFVPFLPGRA